MRLIVAAAALAALAASAIPAHAQEKIELKLSHVVPSSHWHHNEFLEPWGKELERRTNGKVVVRLFPVTSPLGNIANQLDQVRAGVTDIAHGVAGVPRGRMPRVGIVEMPFLFDSADAATRTLWSMAPKYFREDFQGLKLLAIHAHSPGGIHTREKKVERLEDLRGLRIRTPTAPSNEMISLLGGTPVGLPIPAVYENLQRGVVDGTVFPWDPIGTYKLAEVTRHHLEGNLYTIALWFAMNEKKYQSLPADVRKAIDEISGDALIPKFGKWWTTADQMGVEAAKARGNTITKLSGEERKRWEEALIGMLNRQMTGLEAAGIKNAREIYFEMQKGNAKYAKR